MTHALHPDVLNDHFGYGSQGTASAAKYFQSVTDNVNEIAERTIRNAHIRSVHYLGKSGEGVLPFLNTDLLKKDHFSDFNPSNPISVAPRYQAWHRTATFSDMVKYSSSDYPLTNSRLPYAEVEEASIKLLNLNLVQRLKPGRTIQIESKTRKYVQTPSLTTQSVCQSQNSSEPTPVSLLIEEATKGVDRSELVLK